MRKILFFVLLCFWGVSVSAGETKEEAFVNPIFNKGMINLGREPTFVKITPTSYYEENRFGYRTQVKCEMKENMEETVVLRCVHEPEDRNDKQALIIAGYDSEPQVWTYKFVIYPPKDQDDERGVIVRKLGFYKEELEPSSYTGYLIYYSEEQRRKSWESILNAYKD